MLDAVITLDMVMDEPDMLENVKNGTVILDTLIVLPFMLDRLAFVLSVEAYSVENTIILLLFVTV
jgi:hypothetical protein